jgi:hypothetical protein
MHELGTNQQSISLDIYDLFSPQFPVSASDLFGCPVKGWPSLVLVVAVEADDLHCKETYYSIRLG